MSGWTNKLSRYSEPSLFWQSYKTSEAIRSITHWLIHSLRKDDSSKR